MNSTTRTFRARYLVTLDTAVLSAHDHTVTVSSYGDSIQFTLDGQPATYERVEAIRKLAVNLGTFTRISGPSLTPIGKARAHRMHIELARKGYPSQHADLATGVLGRVIKHLRDLTEPEARTVWTCLIYGAGVAA